MKTDKIILHKTLTQKSSSWSIVPASLEGDTLPIYYFDLHKTIFGQSRI